MSANREPGRHRECRTCRLGGTWWWIGLGLLLVNDHVLKGSGFLPGVLTGKLSDFAGLLIAPTVCASAFRIWSRRGLLACHVAVGGAFALLKCSPPIASYWDTFLRELGISASTCPDPTDLVALGSVWWSWKLFGMARARQLCERASHLDALDRFAAILGALACVASLDAAAPPLAPAGKEDTIWGDAFIHIDESITSGYLGIEPFTGELNCRKVLADPAAFLDAEGFNADQAAQWRVLSRFNVALRAAAEPSDPQPDCYLSRVDLFATHPETTRKVFIVAWSSRELPLRTIPARTLSAETPRDGVIVARLVDDELTFEARSAVRIAQEE